MTAICTAPLQLADLVCAMRPDWDRAEVDGAIHAAGLTRPSGDDMGRAFHRLAAELLRIAGDPDGRPRALADAARGALERGPKLPPGRNAELAEEARQLIAERLDAAAQPDDGEACAE